MFLYIFFIDIFIKNDVLEDLCAKFKCFYRLLFDPLGVNAYKNKENSEYLNFWLNKEFKKANISSISVPEFYSKLKFYDRSFDSGNKLQQKMFVFGKEELEHMNTLYDMHNIYNTIISLHAEDKKTCHEYSEECVEKYTDSIGNCSNIKFTNFCKALKSFKEKYDKINSVPMGICKGKNILPLPPEQIQLEEKVLDTELLGGEQKQSLADISPQLLEIPSRETSVNSVQTGRGDSVQEERGDSLPETLGDTQQHLSLSVEGKQTDNYNRVVSVFSNRSLVKSSIRKK
ncbi:unnamed protein product [Plasmodium vivax]|uniref:(malaria parasite P. vivax) hypothetical protein n=1 Tax=Plasmodium vivax TaxID=5855 RepID=A0A8S4H885_PLAVI|nr:unnamed protein product [Plasmodium vivax]